MARPEPAGAGDQRDLRGELASLRKRLEEAEGYLGVDHLRERRAELEAEVSRPDLWDDPDEARRVTSEFSSVNADIDMLEDLSAKLSDAEVLHDLMVEESDSSLLGELTDAVDDVAKKLSDLELRSLFSGEYDERDAIGEVHAGTGGTAAQDWCEMLLRMYLRWAERKGYRATVLDSQPGEGAGLKSATVRMEGENAYGLLTTETGVHRLIRISPFDQAARRHTSASAAHASER